MQNNNLQAEAIIISNYCRIVKEILARHRRLSIGKAATFAYIVKKDKYLLNAVYTGHNTKDLVSKCLSQMSGAFSDYCDNLPYIIKAIHLLIKSKRISMDGEVLVSECEQQPVLQSSFIDNAIRDSQKVSDRQFIKEVVYNV